MNLLYAKPELFFNLFEGVGGDIPENLFAEFRWHVGEGPCATTAYMQVIVLNRVEAG